MECNACGKEIESGYTAYLLNRGKQEGLCKECKEEIEKRDLDNMTYEVFEKLCHAMNGHAAIRDLAESMFRSINREHRYLQNELFMAFLAFFKLYGAQDENHRDARNEWAVQIARIWVDSNF